MGWLFKRPEPEVAPLVADTDVAREIPITEQLDAIEPPAARYRIVESLTFGITTYAVEAWFKRIVTHPQGWGRGYGSDLGFAVESGYEPIASMFATTAAAERWLDGHIHPEKYLTSYDANGNRIEVGE